MFLHTDWPSWGVGKPPAGGAVIRRPLARVLTPVLSVSCDMVRRWVEGGLLALGVSGGLEVDWGLLW